MIFFVKKALQVFPTPVGMVPATPARLVGIYRFPHARGDGPVIAAAVIMRHMFSPRPWGWSHPILATIYSSRVFPTPVGMVLIQVECYDYETGFPHARGDGPIIRPLPRECPKFSPRPWGWSAFPIFSRFAWGVFPTPVGMVR